MTKEQLINLSIGQHILNDGIYQYLLNKSKVDELTTHNTIEIFGQHFGSYLSIIETHIDNELEISVLSMIGGMAVHSDDYFTILNKLELGTLKN